MSLPFRSRARKASVRKVAAAAMSHQARVQLEMGGKNPLVVLDDCDLDRAVQCALDGAFFATGQRCTASSRIIVTQGIHDRFVARAGVESVGAARRRRTWRRIRRWARSPANRSSKPRSSYLDIAVKEGGRRVTGGERLSLDKPGYYVSPVLIADTKPDMRVNSEEVFGPLASTVRVRDYDEALAIANAGEFGLSAGICTTSLKYARHFTRNVRAGMVMTNLPTAGVDYHVPFGGHTEVQLRRARTGFRRRRVLHPNQDKLLLGLIPMTSAIYPSLAGQDRGGDRRRLRHRRRHRAGIRPAEGTSVLPGHRGDRFARARSRSSATPPSS